jgi:hypothetical protein
MDGALGPARNFAGTLVWEPDPVLVSHERHENMRRTLKSILRYLIVIFLWFTPEEAWELKHVCKYVEIATGQHISRVEERLAIAIFRERLTRKQRFVFFLLAERWVSAFRELTPYPVSS